MVVINLKQIVIHILTIFFLNFTLDKHFKSVLWRRLKGVNVFGYSVAEFLSMDVAAKSRDNR